MVGYNSRTKELTHLDIMFAGAVSGCITRATFQPLDVLKIRFQLQVEPIANKQDSKYKSIPQAFSLIYKEEGVKALWKGHVPAQLLSIVYGLSQFWIFNVLTKQAHVLSLDENYRGFVNFTCGAAAGCGATLASFPFDVIRTRLIGQSDQNKIYCGVSKAFASIIRNEGALVLYRGILPTIMQVAPHAGVQFMCYKFFDELYRNLIRIDNKNFSFSSSLVSGSLAGLIAKVTIYPFDLIKKRMQIQGIVMQRQEFGKAFICSGMIDCFRKILVSEGLLGLYKGLNPSILKAVLTTTLHFTAYEMVCKVIADMRS